MKSHSFGRTLAALALMILVAGSAVAATTTVNHRRSPQTPVSAVETGAASHPTAAMPASHTAKAAKSMSSKVDLNSATREQLMALPGIGEAIADKIIAARPFKTKADLLQKGLVNKAEYTKLSGHVTAKQS